MTARLHVFELRGAHAEVVSSELFSITNAVYFLRQVQPAHIGLGPGWCGEVGEVRVSAPCTQEGTGGVKSRPHDLAFINRTP